ncbi:MAG: amidohydrolase family protein [bacterium]
MLKKLKFDIIDAHTHFFSYGWFYQFYELAQNQFPSGGGVEALAQKLGWEAPTREPHDLGKRWVEEQEKYGLKGQVLFASKLGDAEFLSAALEVNPERLIGYVLLDPKLPKAREQTHYSLHILGMKGVLLFPAMHHFHAYEEAVYPIFEEAAAAEVPVFIHFGLFKLPVFQKLGLPDNVDLAYANPRDLQKSASDFPEVNFIIPHFGCGRFQEALEVAAQCKNVYFDTSSSNSWIQPPLTLKQVFEQSLEVLGPGRLLFGTDSSYFPRGWRKDIFDQQLAILQELQIPDKEQKAILGDNVARLLSLK